MLPSFLSRIDDAGEKKKKKRLQKKIDALNILGDIESEYSSSSSDDDEVNKNSITITDNTDERLIDTMFDSQDKIKEGHHLTLNAIPYKPDDDDDCYNEIASSTTFDPSPLLHENSSISVKKAVTSILSIATQFDIPKNAVEQILKTFKSFLPFPNTLPTTYESVLKKIGAKSTSISKYYCNFCYQLCGIRSGKKYCDNSTCEFKNQSLRNGQVSEIVTMDIREQIKSIVGRNILLFNNPEYFPLFDIKSSSLYNNLSSSTIDSNTIKNVRTCSITLNIHTDGAPMVRTTKSALWPCLASIVELPPHVREKQANIVVLCLWLSSIKPNVDLFLNDCIEQLTELSNPFTLIINDLQFVLTVRTQFFVSDLPAKALFWKTINYNGYNACSYCTTEGMQ